MRRRDALRVAAAALAASAPHRPGGAATTRASTALPSVQVLPDVVTIPGLGRPRTLRVYLPPSYRRQAQRRYPVIYLHDGQNLFDDATSYAGEWGVDETLDALALGTGFEAIAVGIDHGGDLRIQEMLAWPHAPFARAEGEAYVDFVARVVKPWIDARYRTRPEAVATAIGGASLGGAISHVAVQRHPDRFGKALIFSPSYFAFEPLFEIAARLPLPPKTRLVLYAGGAEAAEIREPTRRMAALLARQRAASTLHVADGARHHESAWRAAFAPAVRWLFELG